MRDREAAQPSFGLSDLGRSAVGLAPRRTRDILVDQPGAESGQPIAASIALLGSARVQGAEPKRLDYRSGPRPP